MTELARSTLEQLAGEVKEFAKMGLRRKDVAAQAAVLRKCPNLRDLPATRKAGTASATPRFEYLVQAIVDAIDSIEMRGHSSDAQVLRILFGLSDEARRSGWAYRQDRAASQYGVGRDQFRRNIQPALMMEVAETLAAANGDAEAGYAESAVGAVATQDGLVQLLEQYIRENRPAEALLLELSTATIYPILAALREIDVPTRLLVANPYKSSSPWQQERSWMTLVEHHRKLFQSHASLEVRMYSVPPSLRGRVIDDHIQLGWYTYRDDVRYEKESPDAALIWGHDNAMVHGSVSSDAGAILTHWFNREFERLWRHRLTRRGADVTRMLGLLD